MARGRRVALLAVVVVTLTITTSGYTAVTGDRTVGVNVVDDENAYIGVTDKEPTVNAGETKTERVLRVQNRFGSDAEVSVTADTVTHIALELSLSGDGSTLGSGEVADIAGTISCDGSVNNRLSVTADLTVSVDTTGAQAEIDRQVTLVCEPEEDDDEDNRKDGDDEDGDESNGKDGGDEGNGENGDNEDGDEDGDENDEKADENTAKSDTDTRTTTVRSLSTQTR